MVIALQLVTRVDFSYTSAQPVPVVRLFAGAGPDFLTSATDRR
jgi:hypothetical protein